MIFPLFSERTKQQEGLEPEDVYQYDTASPKLRTQVRQILTDAIGKTSFSSIFYSAGVGTQNNAGWNSIHKILCKELGLDALYQGGTPAKDILGYVATADTENFLNTIDVCAHYIHNELCGLQNYGLEKKGISQKPQEALEELNHRFRADRLGYQIEEGQLFKIDSDFTHKEIVKPALQILSQKGFEGPKQEFLDAHRLYREGESAKAILSAANAFESTLKVICDQRHWKYGKGATAADLLKTVQTNGLWPDYLDKSFEQLLATLKSGLPKVRNENGAHGQGSNITETPHYIAKYALHLAAAKIVFAVDAHLENNIK